MYKQCATEQSAGRQRQVERCLLTALKQQHYTELSVSDLCSLAGISRKSFYRYFSGKGDVLDALLDHTFLELDTRLPPDFLPINRNWLTAFFRFWQEQQPLLEALQSSSLLAEVTDRAVQIYRYPDNGSDTLQIRNRYGTAFYAAGMNRIMISWFLDGFRETPEELAEITLSLFPDTAAGSTLPPFAGHTAHIVDRPGQNRPQTQ